MWARSSLGLELGELPGGKGTSVQTLHPGTQSTHHKQLRPGMVVCRVAGVDVVGRGVDAVCDVVAAHPERPLSVVFDPPPAPTSAPAEAAAIKPQSHAPTGIGGSMASGAHRARLIQIYTEHKPRKVAGAS